MPFPDRRHFLKTSAVTLPSLSAVAAAGAADRPNEKMLLAIMGVHGRGKDLLRGFAGLSDVEIAYVCDPDAKVLAHEETRIGLERDASAVAVVQCRHMRA